jgi:polysaccharide deacetylase family protein (PEP-CTERM system associated)
MHDAKRLVVTFDLEDHRPDASYPKRYPDITRAVLDFLESRHIRATVFVLGRLARDDPDLIRDIARRGHEIGFHSYAHTHLTAETPARLRADLHEYKAYLEDLTGTAVNGFRAPAFSLTRASVWAVDVIRDAGFTYSSSVLPANNPVFGFPGAPRRPFRWPNGLLEIPAPVARCGPAIFPFLGGFYLRYLPGWVIGRCLNAGDAAQCYWVYCHPHDFDPEERFYQIAGTSFLTSTLLWFNRKNTLRKLGEVLGRVYVTAPGLAFANLIEAGVFTDAPLFEI